MTFERIYKENRPEEEQCNLCTRNRKFSIRRIRTEQWLSVCGPHDNFVGIENLMTLGYNRREAVALNKEIKQQIPNLFREEDERG